MIIKTKMNKLCLVCKKEAKPGQEVAILKNGIFIHKKECIDSLKDYVKSVQQKK